MDNIVVIFTGGTGGHVIPSVVFGNYLINRGYNCFIITDNRGKKYTNKFSGKVKVISASHLNGGFFFKIFGLLKLFFGLFQSLLFLIKLKPKIVLSFGSYAVLPPCFAVKILKKFKKLNFFIHEQNSIIGKSNKYFVKDSNKIFVNFDKDYNLKDRYKEKIHIVGLPKLDKYKSHSNLNLLTKLENKFVFFLYGGSQGSISIVKFFEKLLFKFTREELNNFFFIIQCPDIYIKYFLKKIKKYKINFEINNFFENLPELLEKIDFIISRCGAGTINDIYYYKIPSLLIPLPSAKDNHQFENANFLINKEKVIILHQDNIDLNKAINFIRQIIKDNYITKKIYNHHLIDANKLMLDLIKNEIIK